MATPVPGKSYVDAIEEPPPAHSNGNSNGHSNGHGHGNGAHESKGHSNGDLHHKANILRIVNTGAESEKVAETKNGKTKGHQDGGNRKRADGEEKRLQEQVQEDKENRPAFDRQEPLHEYEAAVCCLG